MKQIRSYLADRQRDFACHPFFARLRSPARPDDAARFVPRLAFWVMVFQDVLRLNEQRIEDRQLRAIARHHRAEDAGHERWFLGDLRALGIETPDVEALFGAAHTSTRDAAYALIAEVFRARRDHERITLLLCLEVTGHVFFEASADYFERSSLPQAIRYFSRHHIAVEQEHQVFERQMTDFLDSIELAPEERRETLAMIDRMHGAFVTMFDGLLALIERMSQRPRAHSEAPPAA